MDGQVVASKFEVASRTVNIRYRSTNGLSCLAVCVFGRRSVVHHGPGHSFLRPSRAGYAIRSGVGSGFVRQPGLPYLPDGPSMQRDHSAGRVLCHGAQRAVCRRPANAPEARPLFFPVVHSPSSARPCLGPVPIYCIPSGGSISTCKEHDTNTRAWWSARESSVSGTRSPRQGQRTLI